jgi:hypothetical protein
MRGAALLIGGTLGFASADARAGGADAAGYMRISTRPDFQGGGGTLGYWNLYGRLLNEGPYAALELRFDLLEPVPGGREPWTSVHTRVEGGSVEDADPQGGALSAFRMSQLYAQAGNVLIPGVVWQVGTLDAWFGDLGLYDMRPASVFDDTVGASARWRGERLELLVGGGDSGYGLKGSAYNTVPTAGGTARLRLGGHLELGAGGEYRAEPKVVGNRYAPHQTPEMTDYEAWLRGEVVQTWLEEHPGQELDFPDPIPVAADSGKIVAYLGFGDLGPLRWNSLYASFERLHPDSFTVESYGGEEYTLYVKELTDERTRLLVGDEVQLRVVPGRLDVVLAGLYGLHRDADNTIAPSEHARMYRSAVLRTQTYLTPTLHLLVESSLAEERSTNGNQYREHADSIFASTGGMADADGLEYGDTDTRVTWQGKAGFVLNPLGPGIYTRPSLRLLYGVQQSNQNNAFGNSFVESLEQYDDFEAVEQHTHQVLALEMEAWF